MKTVVMCGGAGTRLWPLSRLNMPKQFVQLSDDKDELTLFQQTLIRNVEFTDEFLIVVSKHQVHLAQNQVAALKLKQKVRFLCEPFAKNTAAVIALACQLFEDLDNMLVVPSDHYVAEPINYKASILESAKYIDQKKIVLFGILPTEPETGFGYIKFKNHNVVSFQEKPDLETAEKYLQSGDYLWNSGIFAFKNQNMKTEMQQSLPNAFEVASGFEVNDSEVLTVSENLMQKFENISIDFAVIEKSKNLAILNGSDWHWSDLGSFEALAKLSKGKDKGNIHSYESTNNFVRSEREVVLIGQKDLLVIDTEDALLISSRGLSSKIKSVLPKLSNPELTQSHRTVVRPWGSFSVLVDNAYFKVKSIVVNPGKRLSLQKHKFRSEVWTVVRGLANVTIDNKVFDLQVNETCFIAQGSVHRLANQTSDPVEIVEIQTGESFDESDIVRIEDDYNRT